jgi:predicted Zn-dependent protease
MIRSRFRLSAIAAGALAAAGCGLQLATPSGEARIGAQEAAEVEKSIGLVDAPALDAYVNEIGARIARVAGARDGVEYRFHVVEMVDPNAFALPGGHIYVSRGLLALLNDEDELANALAHEVGHVTARHHLKHTLRQVPFVPVRLAAGVAMAAVELAAWPLGPLGAPMQIGGAAVGLLGEAPASLVLASYSRGQETEADELGQRFASEAGWDPRGMARLMETLSRDTRLHGSDPERMSYFSTHPATPDRTRSALARAGALKRADAAPIAPDRAHF